MDFTQLDLEHKKRLLMQSMCLSSAIQNLANSTGIDCDVIVSGIWLETIAKFQKLNEAQIEDLIAHIETQSSFAQTLSTPVVVTGQIFDSEELQDYGN